MINDILQEYTKRTDPDPLDAPAIEAIDANFNRKDDFSEAAAQAVANNAREVNISSL